MTYFLFIVLLSLKDHLKEDINKKIITSLVPKADEVLRKYKKITKRVVINNDPFG